MALILKRVTNPYECVRCSITKKCISYGEEYYEDDEDGTIIDFNYYYDMMFQKKVEDAMPQLEASMDRFAYQQMMLEKQRQFLDKTKFDRKMATMDKNSTDNTPFKPSGTPPTKGGGN